MRFKFRGFNSDKGIKVKLGKSGLSRLIRAIEEGKDLQIKGMHYHPLDCDGDHSFEVGDFVDFVLILVKPPTLEALLSKLKEYQEEIDSE